MISIALITYNGEKYLREQLDSIFSQTIQDFELVVSDDCSTDSTVDILREYAEKNNNIRIYINKNNLGFIKNIENILNHCTDDFIALADQDDIWTEDHLEVLYSNIGDNFLICGDSLLVDQDNKSLDMTISGFRPYMDLSTLKNNNEHFLRSLIMGNAYQGAAMMLRKKFIEIALPFPVDIIYHDYYFALYTMALNKFSYIPKVIIRHRRHTTNTSANNLNTFFKCQLNTEKKLIPFFESLPELADDKKEIIIQTKKYFSNKKCLIKRFLAIIFWIKNYRIIYATNKKKRFLLRLFTNFRLTTKKIY